MFSRHLQLLSYFAIFSATLATVIFILHARTVLT